MLLVLELWKERETGAEHGDEVCGGTCLGRLTPDLPGSRRAEDHVHGIRKDPYVCACMKMSE